MLISGYLPSVFIGVLLGLIGGGGSILTVPVLVYLFGIEATLATTYSLFIVGASSVVGSLSYFGKNLVNLRTALFFGIPSVMAVMLTRRFVVPAIPSRILEMGNFTLTKSMLLMIVFAVLMVMAAWSMIKKENNADTATGNSLPVATILLQGIGVGAVTGLVGAGGGFLIIPALVNMLKLPMKTAVGTSLFIIAINSVGGFLFSLGDERIHWPFMLTIAGLAIAGIFLGSFLSTRIDGRKLKPAFGWFVLATGLYIIIKETIIQ